MGILDWVFVKIMERKVTGLGCKKISKRVVEMRFYDIKER